MLAPPVHPHITNQPRSVRLGVVAVVLFPVVMGACISDETTLAVLESAQCSSDTAVAVRPLFVKQGSEWKSLASAPGSTIQALRDVDWTIVLRGEKLGNLNTEANVAGSIDSLNAQDFRLPVSEGAVPPMIANEDAAFQGWCSIPAARPLILTSGQHYRDPDMWSRLTPDQSVRDRMYRALQTTRDDIVHCPTDPGTPTQFTFTAADLVLAHAYGDTNGRLLVAVHLDPDLYGCDGPLVSPWLPQSYLIAEEVSRLGESLEFVDAGDFDGDGKSELIFWYGGYNRDGYILFSHDLRRRTDFSWSYH